jgi:hypothetical protein
MSIGIPGIVLFGAGLILMVIIGLGFALASMYISTLRAE